FLPALAIYTVLGLGLRAGIAGACILSSGILVLLITVIHTLLQASRVSRRSRPGASQSLYENDSAQQGESSPSDLSKNVPRPDIQRKFPFPAFLERKSQRGSAGSSILSSSGSPRLRSPRDGSDPPRMHRSLSVESGLLQAQGKAWNIITQEMGNVMARRPGTVGKDSTLV
ncbi:TM221 protein, partial [Formicarius rufipectus]|nr:TM221 protein [Formicarius rufipectus]